MAQRQERVQLRWRDTQRATRRLVHVNRTLPLVATEPPYCSAICCCDEARERVKAGGMVGALVTAGLALLRPRYGRSTRSPGSC